MTPRLHLDANVVVRFLRNDHPEQSPAARRLVERARRGETRLALSAVIVAEVYYVLTKVYKVGRAEAANVLASFLSSPAVEADGRDRVLDALQRVAAAGVDFGDAYLAATGFEAGEGVASFDRDFKAFADITVVLPR